MTTLALSTNSNMFSSSISSFSKATLMLSSSFQDPDTDTNSYNYYPVTHSV